MFTINETKNWVGFATGVFMLGGCVLSLDDDPTEGSVSALRGAATYEATEHPLSLNPADPTSDTAEDIILHAVGSCIDSCIDYLETLTNTCHSRHRAGVIRTRSQFRHCLRIASDEYEECARLCAAEDFPSP